MEHVEKAAILLTNSASDTFVLDRIKLDEYASLLQTAHNGAVINVLIQGCKFEKLRGSETPLVNYNSGSSIVSLGCDLTNRLLRIGGSIANDGLFLIDDRLESTHQLVRAGRGAVFLFGGQARRR
jgi:hypothetical protein